MQSLFGVPLTADMKHSNAKSRDDITALLHVTYSGEDALPMQQDTEMWYVTADQQLLYDLQRAYSDISCFSMSAQDNWQRKHHELWEKL